MRPLAKLGAVLEPLPLVAVCGQVGLGGCAAKIDARITTQTAPSLASAGPPMSHGRGMLEDAKTWQAIVHDGILSANGMVGWKKVMNAAEIGAIRAYVIQRAHEDKALRDKSAGVR